MKIININDLDIIDINANVSATVSRAFRGSALAQLSLRMRSCFNLGLSSHLPVLRCLSSSCLRQLTGTTRQRTCSSSTARCHVVRHEERCIAVPLRHQVCHLSGVLVASPSFAGNFVVTSVYVVNVYEGSHVDEAVL